MTATELALQALGLRPVGQPAAQPGVCLCCGASWKTGDLVTPFVPSSGFMDGRALQPVAPGPKFMCGACGNFFAKEMLAETQRVMLTTDGAYRIGTGAARAWFLLNPPKPPFAVIYKDAASAIINQHVLWRAAVSLDPDYWLVQHFKRSLPLRRKLVLEVARLWREEMGPAFAAFRPTGKPKKKSDKVPKSPFVSLDPLLADLKNGQIRRDIRKWAEEHAPDALRLLDALTPAEQWALGALFFAKPEEVVQPERINLEAILAAKRAGRAERQAAD